MPFRSVWLYGLFIKTLKWGLKLRSEFMMAIKIKIKITKYSVHSRHIGLKFLKMLSSSEIQLEGNFAWKFHKSNCPQMLQHELELLMPLVPSPDRRRFHDIVKIIFYKFSLCSFFPFDRITRKLGRRVSNNVNMHDNPCGTLLKLALLLKLWSRNLQNKYLRQGMHGPSVLLLPLLLRKIKNNL